MLSCAPPLQKLLHMLAAHSVSVEGKKRWSILLGTRPTLLTSVALHSQLVDSLAHELAASPEVTKEESWGRPMMGEAIVKALPLALQKML
jgi:hypothetical protein